MARSAAFQRLARSLRIARFCDRHGFQGFLEGAAVSGLRAADEVLLAL